MGLYFHPVHNPDGALQWIRD
ncbi:uncharacterized protein G2W53_013070 [Senna tora]|uniref:Uncharacterized protein n=1 Tax=Senna tora TaxID=362788 RepID=A0A834WQB0_9FABA|nr:uncharacterized protein G2W53_013070 [Senna tora]